MPQDLDSLREESFDKGNGDDGRIGLLTELIRGPGSRLAAFDTECRLAVCSTLINLLSHDIYRKALIAGDLLRSFISLAYPNSSKAFQADSEPDENLSQCRRGVLKTLYPVCALPDFATAYPLSTALAQDCLTAVRAPHLTQTKNNTRHSAELLPPSIACVILTSLTQSEQTALALIADHKISEPLPDLLSSPDSPDSPDIVYPAVSFVGRLALPAPNKPALLKHGLLAALHRFLTPAFDAAPAVQREAVTAIRRLVAGSPPQTIASMRPSTEKPLKETQATEKQSSSQSTTDVTATTNNNDSDSNDFLAAALTLFHRCDDRALKLEIGRLAIEICRSLWPSSPSQLPSSLPSSSPAHGGNPEDAETETNTRFNTALGGLSSGSRRAFASAIAFVILHGENAGARAEGWFGFALLAGSGSGSGSGSAGGRGLVLGCFDAEEDVRAQMEKVVAEGEGGGAAWRNARVVVAQLRGRAEDGEVSLLCVFMSRSVMYLARARATLE